MPDWLPDGARCQSITALCCSKRTWSMLTFVAAKRRYAASRPSASATVVPKTNVTELPRTVARKAPPVAVEATMSPVAPLIVAPCAARQLFVFAAV